MVSQGDDRWEVMCLRFGSFGAFLVVVYILKDTLSLYCFHFLANFICGDTYGNMAGVYQLQGKLDLALEYYAKALEISIAALGEKHPSVGDTYGNMAGVYQLQGKLDLALEYYAKALEISIATLGEKHPSVGETLENIGLVHYSSQDYSAALPLFEKTLEIRLQFLGESHSQTQKTQRLVAEMKEKLK